MELEGLPSTVMSQFAVTLTFDFWCQKLIRHAILRISLPNFTQIHFSLESWSHIDFSRWRRRRCKSTSGCGFGDVTQISTSSDLEFRRYCCIQIFRYYEGLTWNCLFHLRGMRRINTSGVESTTPCLKKLCKLVFVRTSSNLYQFW